MPDDPQLLLSMAESYERTRNYDKAIDVYERILKKNPDAEAVINNLATLLTDYKGDGKSLKRAKDMALRFEASPQPAFQDTLAWAYYKSGEADKAVAILENVITRAPKNPIFQYHIGMVYHKLGNLAAAKTHLAKALDSNVNFAGIDEARETLKKIP
jgi:tetratricopeptide (TPR) repeat protein